MSKKPLMPPTTTWKKGSTVQLLRVTEYEGRYVGDGSFTLEFIAEDGSPALLHVETVGWIRAPKWVKEEVHAIRAQASDQLNVAGVRSRGPASPAACRLTIHRVLDWLS